MQNQKMKLERSNSIISLKLLLIPMQEVSFCVEIVEFVCQLKRYQL